MTHFFDFEKNIIENCSSTSHLLITAEGLDILKITTQLLQFYNHLDTLCLVLNTEGIEDKFTEFCNLKSMTLSRRKESYEIGGVKICTSQTVLTDILNGYLRLSTVSAIFIPQAEKIKKDSVVAFILSITKQISKGTVIKAFTDQPLKISRKHLHLSDFLSIFRINKVLLYPRFHNQIVEDLKKDPQLNETKIKMPTWMEDVQLYLLELIQGVKNEIEKYAQKRTDISNFYTYTKQDQANERSQRKESTQDYKNVNFGDNESDSNHKNEFNKNSESNHKNEFNKKIEPNQDSAPQNDKTFSTRTESFSYKKKQNDLNSLRENTLNNIQQTLSNNLKDLRYCLDSLFSIKLRNFATFYAALYQAEIDRKGKTWILNPASHVIMETVNEILEDSHDSYKSGQTIKQLENTSEKDSPQHENKEIAPQNKKNAFFKRSNSKFRDRKFIELIKLIKRHKPAEILVITDHTSGTRTIDERNVKIIQHSEFDRTDADLIILLDFSLSTLRKIELLDREIDVFLLYYRNSYEEEQYLSQVRNEKETFERFIEEKANMGIVEYEHYLPEMESSSDEFDLIDPKKTKLSYQRESKSVHRGSVNYNQSQNYNENQNYSDLNYNKNINNHNENNNQSQNYNENNNYDNSQNYNDSNFVENTFLNNKHEIVVDYRELRSSLPLYLHKAGNSLRIECLLEGDYLFPKFIIERKSIYDLIQSFNTGRLLTQMQRIFTNYSHYYLLIEYDIKPSLFAYTSAIENTKTNLIAKFTLLAVRFPNLRFIHTNSDLLSVKCIRALQNKLSQNKNSQNISQSNYHNYHNENKNDYSKSNHQNDYSKSNYQRIEMHPTLLDIVLSIPGISSFHIPSIRKHFTNLKGFINSTVEEKIHAIGIECAHTVHKFFHS